MKQQQQQQQQQTTAMMMNNATSYLSPLPHQVGCCCPSTSNKRQGFGQRLLQIRRGSSPRKTIFKNEDSKEEDQDQDHDDDQDHLLHSLERALSIQTSFMSHESRVSSLGSILHDPLEDDSSHSPTNVTANADIASFRTIQAMKKKESRWQSTVVDTKQDSIPFTPRRPSQEKVGITTNVHDRHLTPSPVSVSSFHRGTTTTTYPSAPLPSLLLLGGDAAPLPPRRTSLQQQQQHNVPHRPTRRASCNDTLPPPVFRRHRQTRRASCDTLPTPPLRRGEDDE